MVVNDDEHVESCTYSAVCRVPSSPHAQATVPACLQTASDLLLAIADTHLHVFSRRADRVPSVCVCHGSVTAGSGVPLSQHGFVCPHVTAYDDVAHALTLSVSSITHVYMTYRTAEAATSTSSTKAKGSGGGVATRTRDLVIRIAPSTVLWLEFEHNLARGWFLEALTTAAAASSSSSLEIDYLDLSDASAVRSITDDTGNGAAPLPLSLPHDRGTGCRVTRLSAPTACAFLRDAWRHVIYEKVKLALQAAQDTPPSSGGDPTVSCLLTTAMELSTRLDEPDLNALTWLTSGFLNLRASEAATVAKKELALAQVLHSLDLARENSLDYIACLALQCAASALGQRPETVAKARDLLTQATRLLTRSASCAAMEPSLKMQLHATLRELTTHKTETTTAQRPAVQRAHSVMSGGGGSLLPTKLARDQLTVLRSGSSSSLTIGTETKPATFSLWAHVFSSSRGGGGGGDTAKPLLLLRVPKPVDSKDGDATGGSLLVDVLGAHGVHKARFRVFYDASSTVAWLTSHVTSRYKASAAEEDEDDKSEAVVAVEVVYDPQRKLLVPAQERVSQWVTSAREYVLHAKLAPRIVSSHHRSSSLIVTPPESGRSLVRSIAPTADEQPEAPSVLCSLCSTRIPLSNVEDHSETCF